VATNVLGRGLIAGSRAVKDNNKTDASPESTWGANEDAKAKWDRTHGATARKAAKQAAKDEEK
jgi:hypothetical protein